MECILGVDAGGTKCSAMLVDDSGTILGWGRYAHPGVSGRTTVPIVVAVSQAITGVEPDVVHLALGCSIVPASIMSSFHHVSEVTLEMVSEHEASFRLAEHEHGVIALAGTGAFVHVVTPDGDQLRLDGRGPLIGDFGSGFYIGLKALQAAVRSHFHPRHETTLARAVVQALGRAKLSDLGNFHLGYNDRSTVASLARVVDEQARAGDAVSKAILIDAADTLAETVHDGLARFDLFEEDLPLIGTGSVITNSALYWDHLCRTVHGFAPGLRPELLPQPQVIGIVLQAFRKRYPENYPQLREALLTSLGQHPEPATVELEGLLPNATKRPTS